MTPTTRPLFALYVLWHPGYAQGRELADRLRRHIGHSGYGYIDAGPGISVVERSTASPPTRLPLPVEWDGADFTAVVALVDASLVADDEWASYMLDIAGTAQTKGLPASFFPVAMDERALDLPIEQQALRWDRWEAPDAERTARLTTHLTHEFCRVIRTRLDELRPPTSGGKTLERYLKPLRVFISYSTHDEDGETVARSIRDWVDTHGPVDSFLADRDIPAGVSFAEVLEHEIGADAVLAVRTDSYSSRKWCQWEVIQAKRRRTPMVVVDCLRDVDPRGMAYLGNVPVVRMDPAHTDRIATTIDRLMNEVFRTWLWLCQVGTDLVDAPGVLFTARPPELIALAALPPRNGDADRTIVYPHPALSAEDERLFAEVAPGVRVQTLTHWLEERR